MSTLFTDPVRWSGAAVRTWPRFWLMAVGLAALLGLAMDQAMASGWRSAASLGLLLVAFQLMLLYAMRRMYLLLQEQKGGTASLAHD